jgi:hypothetical protein
MNFKFIIIIILEIIITLKIMMINKILILILDIVLKF